MKEAFIIAEGRGGRVITGKVEMTGKVACPQVHPVICVVMNDYLHEIMCEAFNLQVQVPGSQLSNDSEITPCVI